MPIWDPSDVHGCTSPVRPRRAGGQPSIGREYMKIDHAKVVVRYKDGRVVKGTTLNFDVRKPGFLLRPLGADEDTVLVPIRLCDLKAIFFVRDFAGDPAADRTAYGREVRGRREAGRREPDVRRDARRILPVPRGSAKQQRARVRAEKYRRRGRTNVSAQRVTRLALVQV